MAHLKIYGHREHLDANRSRLSDALHEAVVEVFALPVDKRFQRFFPLNSADFIHPPDRSVKYTIIEILCFSGRTIATKKALILAIYAKLAPLGMSTQDIEITILEAPKSDWGLRGLPGDEVTLNYQVEK